MMRKKCTGENLQKEIKTCKKYVFINVQRTIDKDLEKEGKISKKQECYFLRSKNAFLNN